MTELVSTLRAQPDRILRRPEVERRTGLSRSAIYRRIADPNSDFPAPVDLGGNAVGWRESQIAAWLETRPVRMGARA